MPKYWRGNTSDCWWNLPRNHRNIHQLLSAYLCQNLNTIDDGNKEEKCQHRMFDEAFEYLFLPCNARALLLVNENAVGMTRCSCRKRRHAGGDATTSCLCNRTRTPPRATATCMHWRDRRQNSLSTRRSSPTCVKFSRLELSRRKVVPVVKKV
jgi:hypothetical protein